MSRTRLIRRLATVVVVFSLAPQSAACGAAKARAPYSPSYASPDEAAPLAEVTATSGGGTAVAAKREPFRLFRRRTAQANAGPGTPAQPAPTSGAATVVADPEPQLKEQLVVEGWLTLEVDEVPEAATAIHKYIEDAGGRVMREQLSGGSRSWSGQLQVKLPPGKVPAFITWLGEKGTIKNKNIHAQDVSRTLFDQQIALDNYERTLARMRTLLDRQGLEMKDVLAIETEMTRLRGEIEKLKGAQRFLQHRVALATLDIHIRRREGVILGAQAKFYPGPRFSALVLFSPGERERMRLGGGVAIHSPIPRLTWELDVFSAPEGESTSVLATFGGAFYSDFLGRGRRRFLNPYLGMRLGYGYLDGSAFVVTGGGGVELFKHKYVLVDANVNAVAFLRDDPDLALVGSATVVFAF